MLSLRTCQNMMSCYLKTKGVEEEEISRPTLERLFAMRANYKVTGRHPGYRKYNGDGSIKE